MNFDHYETEIQFDELPEPFVPTAEDYMVYKDPERLRYVEGAD